MGGDKKKIISIIGGRQGAGATFVATSLAFIMAQYQDGITYLEGGGHGDGHALPFYELSLDKHISRRRFADFFALKAAGEPTDNRVNLYGNLNWVVRAPNGELGQGGPTSGRQQQTAVLLPADVAGRYILWDDGNFAEAQANHGAEPLAASTYPDLILCVIDPLPSRIKAAEQQLSALKAARQSGIMWVFNRTPSLQAAKEAERTLKIRADFVIPMQLQETLYMAERAHVHPADPANRESRIFPSLEKEAEAAFEEMAKTILTLY